MIRGRSRFLDGTARVSRVSTVRTGVKSIQSSTIDLNGVLSNTATLSTPVNVNNSLLYHNGFNVAGSATNAKICSTLLLTSSTVVTATCLTAATAVAIPVAFTVIEFYPGILKSVQRGTITMNSAALTGTSAITAVATKSSVINMLGFRMDSTSPIDFGQMPFIALTSSTLVTATTGVSTVGAAMAVVYQVAEFY